MRKNQKVNRRSLIWLSSRRARRTPRVGELSGCRAGSAEAEELVEFYVEGHDAVVAPVGHVDDARDKGDALRGEMGRIGEEGERGRESERMRGIQRGADRGWGSRLV
eukprot:6190007-Pleurochrysis_carterae.AAC.3